MAQADRFSTPSPAAGAGSDDFSLDLAVRKLRGSIVGKLVQTVGMDASGTRRLEATRETPAWAAILTECEGLLGRTRHLQVALIQATALLETRGLPGAAEGLELLSEMICRFWEELAPPLEAEEGLDPSERFGIIENLSLLPAPDDPIRFVERLRAAPLAEARGVGAFSLSRFRDPVVVPLPGTPDGAPAAEFFDQVARADEAHGRNGAAAESRPSTAAQAAMAVNRAALARAIVAVTKMRDFLAEVPQGRAPEFDHLERTLAAQERFFELYTRREMGPADVADPVPEEARPEVAFRPAAGEPSQPPAARPALAGPPGQIQSPAQVIELLDRICAYYQQAEPSSPVPLLLRRAQRLVGKSFLEAVADLAGGPIEQIRVVTGASGETGQA